MVQADLTHWEALHRQETASWWHVNKRNLVFTLLEGHLRRSVRVLVMGLGGGRLVRLLARQGWEVFAADRLFEAARFARENDVPRALVCSADAGWPFREGAFHALLMLDILAQSADPAACLWEAWRILAVGGCLVLTVPAYPLLYARRDRALGHRRRYTRRAFKKLLEGVGFRVIRLSYSNLAGLLPAVLLRGRDLLFRPPVVEPGVPDVPQPLNALLALWGRLESRIVWGVGLPLGLSLVALVEKRED
ncbi:MAG: methyltransferase domain-containing protein [Planctomycetota bacterium]